MTIAIILNISKLMFSKIFSFLTTKTGQYCIIVFSIIILLVLIHHDGYKKGILEEKNKQEKLIKIALIEQSKKQNIENKNSEIFIDNKIKTRIIYKDKIKTINKMIINNPIYTSNACKMSDSDIKTLNDNLDSIK